MKLFKTMKYKIKHLVPMAAIAGATLLPPACCKVEQEKREPHHNTTYVWGIDNWSAVWPADKVAASADSVLVDNVFLMNDGRSFEGQATTTILKTLNKIIDVSKPENRYKIRGAGILNDTWIGNDQALQDSISLAKMGFTFGKVYYNGYDR